MSCVRSGANTRGLGNVFGIWACGGSASLATAAFRLNSADIIIVSLDFPSGYFFVRCVCAGACHSLSLGLGRGSMDVFVCGLRFHPF